MAVPASYTSNQILNILPNLSDVHYIMIVNSFQEVFVGLKISGWHFKPPGHTDNCLWLTYDHLPIFAFHCLNPQYHKSPLQPCWGHQVDIYCYHGLVVRQNHKSK